MKLIKLMNRPPRPAETAMVSAWPPEGKRAAAAEASRPGERMFTMFALAMGAAAGAL